MTHYDEDEEFSEEVPPTSTAIRNERKIFIGNLPFKTESEDIEVAFNKFGTIIGVNIRKDRDSGKPKGFGFVTFDSEYAADRAISEMNGKLFQGRTLTVRQAILRNSVPLLEKVVIDISWKTVPSEKKSKTSISKSTVGNSNDRNRNSTASNTTTAPHKTWENWAGPIKK